ncbi:MAG: YigZ family protein [Spirochaetes bacterium]|nr:YigZ family protein [Paludibacteraceae bacterium]MBP9044036.1 YigZ family protein [Spirochaetota bacterium]
MQADDTYQTIELKAEGLYKEKGSRFIALAFPVSSEVQVKAILDDLRQEYHDARHHSFAYIVGYKGERWRANDDGEPSGTAGKPIYGQLLSFNLTNVLVVVVRYFGGTKLGVSGLINAYKTAACNALKNARIVTKTIDQTFSVFVDYPAVDEVMRVIKDLSIQVVEQQFDIRCMLRVSVRQSLCEEFTSRISKVESAWIDSVDQ